MHPSLRERLDWRRRGAPPGARAAPAVMARSLAYMFGAAGALAIAALALPQHPRADQLGMALTAVAQCCVAVAVTVAFDRLPAWAFRALLACATLLVSAEIYFTGDPMSVFAFLYVWIYLYAFYFLSRSQASLQAALVGGAYAAVLLLRDPAGLSVTRWLITIGTLTAAGALVALLKEQVEGLIARLDDAARTDSLTGLSNRRAFEEAIELEMERARRAGRPLSLLLGDIDHFKRVNDSLGHQAGDEVLRRLGAILCGSKRRIDTAARIGGEEFALLAPDTDEHSAYILAERLRARVEDAFADYVPRPTISFGVASNSRAEESPDQLTRAADEALYAAKELGRNRTVIDTAETATILERRAAASRRAAEGKRQSERPAPRAAI